MHPTHIKSKENAEIKFAHSLKLKKKRKLNRSFLIEGVRSVSEAVAAEKAEKIYCTQDVFNKLQTSLTNQNVSIVSETLMKYLTGTKTPQGIIAICKFIDEDFHKIIQNGKKFVFVENINDPGNLGTLIRTAHAAKVDGLIISKNSADLYNPKTLRATMGSIFHVPIAIDVEPFKCIELADNKGASLIGLTSAAPESIYETGFRYPVMLFIGSEAYGLPKEIILKMHKLAKIPMPGSTESLNASVAGSIAMMEFVRRTG